MNPIEKIYLRATDTLIKIKYPIIPPPVSNIATWSNTSDTGENKIAFGNYSFDNFPFYPYLSTKTDTGDLYTSKMRTAVNYFINPWFLPNNRYISTSESQKTGDYNIQVGKLHTDNEYDENVYGWYSLGTDMIKYASNIGNGKTETEVGRIRTQNGITYTETGKYPMYNETNGYAGLIRLADNSTTGELMPEFSISPTSILLKRDLL